MKTKEVIDAENWFFGVYYLDYVERKIIYFGDILKFFYKNFEKILNHISF